MYFSILTMTTYCGYNILFIMMNNLVLGRCHQEPSASGPWHGDCFPHPRHSAAWDRHWWSALHHERSLLVRWANHLVYAYLDCVLTHSSKINLNNLQSVLNCSSKSIYWQKGKLFMTLIASNIYIINTGVLLLVYLFVNNLKRTRF